MKKLSLLLIIIPVITGTIAGFISSVSFSDKAAKKANKELAVARSNEISAIIKEFNAYLATAAEIELVQKAAANDPDAKEDVISVLSLYMNSRSGITDIMITSAEGEILASVLNDFDDGELFRDVEELTSIAPTPNPVSKFYEGGRFFCAKPIKDNGGYIILVTDFDFVRDLIAPKDFTTANKEFDVYDENNYFIKSNVDAAKIKTAKEKWASGNIKGTKWRWVADYSSAEAVFAGIGRFLVPFSIMVISAVACIIILKKKG